MSLGREIQDFVAAFNTTARTFNDRNPYYRRNIHPDSFPTVKNAATKYKQDYGSSPPAIGGPNFEPSTYGGGYGSEAYEPPSYADGGEVLRQRQREYGMANATGMRRPPVVYDEDGDPIVIAGPQPGALPNTIRPEDDRSLGNDDSSMAEYPQNGPVRDAPMALSADRMPGMDSYPRPPSQGASPGSGGGGRGALPAPPPARKALTDQTRTAAYDPETEGSPPVTPAGQQGALPASSPAPQGAVGAPTPLHGAPPAGGSPAGSPQVPYNPTAGGEGSSSNAVHDLTAALDGGLKFAQHAFHLVGDGAALPGTDPHQAGGRQALMSGVGAATPDMVKAIDAKVNQHPKVPQDESIWAIRRLEAIYRWYSMNGETDKANKSAFELMQYSAGVASKYGQQALTQLKAGDQQGAVKSIVEGHNYIPDGRKLQVNGEGQATVVDARTGEPVQVLKFTPQMVFNAALGLSDRSMYWDVLMNRAGQAVKRGGTTRSDSQQELDRARADYYKARTGQVGKAKAGKGGPAGPSPALQGLIDKVQQIDASRGKTPASTPAPTAPSPPQGSNDGPDVEGDNDEDDTPAGAAAPNAGGEGGGEAPVPAQVNRQMESPVRLSSSPGQETTQPTQPTEQMGGRAGQPAQQPSPAAAGPSSAVGDGAGTGPARPADPDEVPDRVFARNGAQYEPPTPDQKPKSFDQPRPGDNPYRPLLLEAAKVGGREGVQARTLLNARVKEFDDEAKKWDRDRREFDASERKRVTDETKTGREAQKQRMRETYDRRLKPHELKDLHTDIGTALDAATSQVDPEKLKASPLGDGSIEPDQFRNVAASLVTSNENMDAASAVRLTQRLLRTGSEPGDRAYKPIGKDVLGNVILMDDKYGPVHVRPQNYKTIVQTVKSREQAAQKAVETPPKPGVGAKAAEAAGALPSYLRSGQLVKDAAKVGATAVMAPAVAGAAIGSTLRRKVKEGGGSAPEPPPLY